MLSYIPNLRIKELCATAMLYNSIIRDKKDNHGINRTNL